MSAPTTRDPLVVNTQDGSCWTRRAVTREGRGLYALADVAAGVPDEVLASLAELAEHGLASMADALPMPVGAKPLELSEQQIEALAAAGNRVVNDATHEHLCMCDAWPEKCVSTGHYYMGAWDVSGLEDALPAVLALWEQMRGGELLHLRARVAELEAGLPVAQEALFKALDRVSELEAERHSTNGALDDAVQALRTRNADEAAEVFVPQTERSRFVAIAEALNAAESAGLSLGIDLDGTITDHAGWSVVWDRDAGQWTVAGYEDEPAEPSSVEVSADRLTAFFAPTQALREDSHDGPLRHSYLISRDLPKTGGA